jgi:hypothetical protein
MKSSVRFWRKHKDNIEREKRENRKGIERKTDIANTMKSSVRFGERIKRI